MHTEEHSIALTDAHASVDADHVPAAIVHWSARGFGDIEEVDEELFLTL